ncbi:MAG: imidazolonepropionase [Sphingobacterium sp.]
MKSDRKLIGPFKQLLSMRNLSARGALRDTELGIVEQAGMLLEANRIAKVGVFETLKAACGSDVQVLEQIPGLVILPGYIDCHTHIAFGGSRAQDYAMRNSGSSYLEIAESGGGIWSTVSHTRACSLEELTQRTLKRASALLEQGVTTVEVKSGYGLNVQEELKILRAIQLANQESASDLIATCLAAHMLPRDFSGGPDRYLKQMTKELFPLLLEERLSHRIDAFVEQSAFSAQEIRPYLVQAKAMGFDLTIHADQFTTSGSSLAVELQALSADHLEASGTAEIEQLAASDTVAVALPAASLGLGCNFTPARALLDHGARLAIATDWNPGSAPMGNLITSASIMAAREKLSNAELLAGITFRAADALGLSDRGKIEQGMLADFVVYQTDSYRDISYLQGGLPPYAVWKDGVEVFKKQEPYEFRNI